MAHAIRRYLVVSGAQADVLALWAAHTHALGAAEFSPYLHITSPDKRCGKSRLLDVLALLVAKPWPTAHVTPAVLYRRIEDQQPTLLLDELDQQMGGSPESNAVIRGVLNSGFHRGGGYSCCEKRDGDIGWRDFATFCPKALAGIGHLWDTVADRSIPVVLRRKLPTERVVALRVRDAAWCFEPLRAGLAAWCGEHLETLRAARPKMPAGFNDRQADVAEPLLAITDLAGGDWPERAREALAECWGGSMAEDDSAGVKLLKAIRAAFEARQEDRIGSAELAMAASPVDGPPLSAPRLAWRLRPYGLTPRNIRMGQTVTKGYLRADFEDAWRRYLPDTRRGGGRATRIRPPQPRGRAASGCTL